MWSIIAKHFFLCMAITFSIACQAVAGMQIIATFDISPCSNFHLIINYLKMLSGYLGVGVHQLDVVVEHVKGGFHLTRSGISNQNLCKNLKR